jgi:hypothetical protein
VRGRLHAACRLQLNVRRRRGFRCTWRREAREGLSAAGLGAWAHGRASEDELRALCPCSSLTGILTASGPREETRRHVGSRSMSNAAREALAVRCGDAWDRRRLTPEVSRVRRCSTAASARKYDAPHVGCNDTLGFAAQADTRSRVAGYSPEPGTRGPVAQPGGVLRARQADCVWPLPFLLLCRANREQLRFGRCPAAPGGNRAAAGASHRQRRSEHPHQQTSRCQSPQQNSRAPPGSHRVGMIDSHQAEMPYRGHPAGHSSKSRYSEM